MLLDEEIEFIHQVRDIALFLLQALEVIVCHFLDFLLAVRLEQIALAVLERHGDVLAAERIGCIEIVKRFLLNALGAFFAVIGFPDGILLVGIEDDSLDGLLADTGAREVIAVIIHAGSCIGIRCCELFAGQRQAECIEFLFDCNKGLAVLLGLVLDPLLSGHIVDIRLGENLFVIVRGFRILKGLAALAERFDCLAVSAGRIIKVDAGTYVIVADGHRCCRIFAAGRKTHGRTCRKQNRTCFPEKIHG